jgi:arylsulfatase A-like enzyme
MGKGSSVNVDFTWPDGGATPFRGEKNTPYEGGYRVPCAIRWPGVIKPGTVSNELFAHEDMLPTLLAAAGVPDVKEQLLKGMKVGNKTFRVHLDGYNLTDALAGKTPSPRKEFFLLQDDGSLVALRYDKWKILFQEQRAHGMNVWENPFTPLRLPKIFNLRSDPFETADHEGHKRMSLLSKYGWCHGRPMPNGRVPCLAWATPHRSGETMAGHAPSTMMCSLSGRRTFPRFLPISEYRAFA